MQAPCVLVVVLIGSLQSGAAYVVTVTASPPVIKYDGRHCPPTGTEVVSINEPLQSAVAKPLYTTMSVPSHDRKSYVFGSSVCVHVPAAYVDTSTGVTSLQLGLLYIVTVSWPDAGAGVGDGAHVNCVTLAVHSVLLK